jgi:hypothetical protein
MDVQAVPHGRPTIAINAILLSVAWTAVLLRFYTRLRIMKTVFWEDLLAVVSIVRCVDNSFDRDVLICVNTI